jgi:small subunit ribosomal protein S16
MKFHSKGGEKVAVKIRLKRMGAKKRPFYRVVVADSRMPRDGRFIEEIGYYNPLTDPIEVKINEEKAADWLKKGAIPTDTVKYLFKNIGILADKKTVNQQSESQQSENEA